MADHVSPDPLIPAKELREIFGVSDMTIWRWLDDKRLNFPRPIVVRRRRYWRKSDIAEFQARNTAAAE